MGSCRCPLLLVFFGFLLTSSFAQRYQSNGRCRTPDGIEASCVDVYQCESMIDLLKTLIPPHSPAVSRRLYAYKCGGINRVCCPKDPIVLDPSILYHNREVAPDVTGHKNYHLLPEDCGYVDSNIRVRGGDDAGMNEFPWMALLQYKTSHGLRFLCGGTIINFNYILTAAHCLGLKDAELVSVRVGEYSIKNQTDCELEDALRGTLKCNPSVQDVKVEEIISHPQFIVRTKNILNDIALLRVSRIRKDVNVFPICLPVGEKKDWPIRNVYVTGWGVTDPRTQETADILQKISLPIVDNRSCAKTYSSHGIDLTKTQICAGGEEGKSSCSGDSGGPMQVAAFIDGNFALIQQGIVSVGPSFCGIKGYPAIFTMVKFYTDWILDNMKP